MAIASRRTSAAWGPTMRWLTFHEGTHRRRYTAADRCLALQVAAALLMQPAQVSGLAINLSAESQPGWRFLASPWAGPWRSRESLPQVRLDAATGVDQARGGGGDGEPFAPGGSPSPLQARN